MNLQILSTFFSLFFGITIQNPNSYTSYQTTPFCSPSHSIIHPSSVREIQKIILQAILSKKNVKAIGSRHSTTDLICTDGIPLSMDNFKVMKINPDNSVAFGAGVKLGEALEFLKNYEKSLIHIPGFFGITIAGAIGTRAHGSTLRHKAALSDQVVGLKIIDGKGVIRTISKNSLDLNAFRIHLGLLGVITEVTLETVPLFKMKAERTLEPESILRDGTLLKLAEDYDFIQAAWFPSKLKVVVVKGMYSENNIPGDSVVTLFTNVTLASSIALCNAFDTIHETKNILGFQAIEDYAILSLYQKVIGRVPIHTEDYKKLTNPAVEYAYKLMAGGCTQCAWDHGNNSLNFDENSVATNISELPKIVKIIKGILSKIGAGFPFSGIAFRFGAFSSSLMSISKERKSVIVDVLYPNRIDSDKPKSGLGAYQAITQALIEKHGGRPHWGKNGLYYHNEKFFRKTIPAKDLKQFQAAMKTYDPLGVFQNKFAKRLLGLSNKVDIDPAIKHCALRDFCICKNNKDCGTNQRCGLLFDVDGKHSYRICKDWKTYKNKAVGVYDAYNLTSVLVACQPIILL